MPTGDHSPTYFLRVSPTDPGAVGYQVVWVDDSTDPATIKVRNATDDDWTEITATGLGDKTYNHIQLGASATWNVVHNLSKFPSVTVVDSGGSTVIGDVTYIDDNNLTITFSVAFSGNAYMN